jgi:hypothetical protein
MNESIKISTVLFWLFAVTIVGLGTILEERAIWIEYNMEKVAGMTVAEMSDLLEAPVENCEQYTENLMECNWYDVDVFGIRVERFSAYTTNGRMIDWDYELP